jgi:hypothetical protein
LRGFWHAASIAQTARFDEISAENIEKTSKSRCFKALKNRGFPGKNWHPKIWQPKQVYSQWFWVGAPLEKEGDLPRVDPPPRVVKQSRTRRNSNNDLPFARGTKVPFDWAGFSGFSTRTFRVPPACGTKLHHWTRDQLLSAWLATASLLAFTSADARQSFRELDRQPRLPRLHPAQSACASFRGSRPCTH